jgi:hypothetical protein
VRSVRGISATLAATAPVAVLLTGCVSTQTVAARARLVDARTIASQGPTEVTRANPAVSVGAPVVIREPAGSAIVISLRNDSARALTDLPVSVGVRTRSGRELYLNRSANLEYFASHVAAIAPHTTTTWVFTTSGRLPAGKTFATVGYAEVHPRLGPSLPSITVSVRTGPSLAVSIVNRSTIPQYDVPVYAVALRDGRIAAAGLTTVAHLGTHGRSTSTISLLGSSRYDSLQLTASPTIFH